MNTNHQSNMLDQYFEFCRTVCKSTKHTKLWISTSAFKEIDIFFHTLFNCIVLISIIFLTLDPKGYLGSAFTFIDSELWYIKKNIFKYSLKFPIAKCLSGSKILSPKTFWRGGVLCIKWKCINRHGLQDHSDFSICH